MLSGSPGIPKYPGCYAPWYIFHGINYESDIFTHVTSFNEAQAGGDSKLVRLRTGNFKRHCHFRSEVYSMVESEPKGEVTTI